jgi:hypothetical protein
MKHPLVIMKEDEARLSREGLARFGSITVFPLCLGCSLCKCAIGSWCDFGPNEEPLIDHLQYAMRKGMPCNIICVCVDQESNELECECCCKDSLVLKIKLQPSLAECPA